MATPTTAQSLGEPLKSTRDIMRQEKGRYGEPQFTLPDGGAHQLRNAVNQLQSLLYAA